MPKRRLLGCTFPVLIGVLLFFLVLTLIAVAGGPVGKVVLAKIGVNLTLPGWLSLPRPELKLPAEEVFSLFGLPVANSIIAGWLSIIVLTVVSYLATHRMKTVPGRFQAAFEFVLGAMFNLCESVAGEKNGRRFFPLVATIFLFVIFNAWLSLLPGFGSITIVNPEGHEVHLLRGANTDINTPLALALISFIFVEFFGLRAHGTRYLAKFINVTPFFKSIGLLIRGGFRKGVSGLMTGLIDIFIGFVNMAVGLLEALSELVRIISFTFRLFGNMTAGEILLVIVAFLVPWVIGDIFYGFELLFGFVQALIFSTLTLVFLTVATAAHGEETHTDQPD